MNSSTWPYSVRVDSIGHGYFYTIECWLIENMGQINHRWAVFNYHLTYTTYYFKQEADAIVFKLRWS